MLRLASVGDGVLDVPRGGTDVFALRPGEPGKPALYRRAVESARPYGMARSARPPCLKGAGTADPPRGRDWGIRSSAPARGEPNPPGLRPPPL